MIIGQEYLRASQAAIFLGSSRWLLHGLAGRGEGPKCSRVGRGVFYKRSDLVDWMAAHEDTVKQ